jgi:uncharacterized membrane protein YdbT with pleckstrin-like domain
MELHDGETMIYEGHPSWRSILGFYLKGLVAAIVVGVIVFLITSLALGIVALVVVLALLVIAGLVKRVSTDFIITTERLHIRRGILSKAVQQTRLERVQNVNTSQSFLERVLRVGRVDFDTAGNDDSDFVFDGVDDPAGVVAAVEKAQRLARGTSPDVPQGL